MSNLDWKEILDRAEWTFAQAFLATVGAAGTGFVSVGVLKTAGLAAGAAVISVLKNVFVQPKTA